MLKQLPFVSSFFLKHNIFIMLYSFTLYYVLICHYLWLNNIVIWNNHILLIHRQLMDIWIFFSFWPLCKCCHVILWRIFYLNTSFQLCGAYIVPRIKLPGHVIILHLTFWETPHGCTILHSHQQCIRIPILPYPYQYLLLIITTILGDTNIS